MAQEVRVGLHDAEPVAYREEGKPKGFAVEILEHIAKIEGWTLIWDYGTWTECVERLEQGEIDLLFPMMPTDERKLRFDFTSHGFFSTWGRVFAHPGSKIETITNLAGKTIAVVQGGIFNQEIRKITGRHNIQCQFAEFSTKTEALDALAEDRVDAAAIEGKAGYFYALHKENIQVTPIFFLHAVPHLAVKKGKNAEIIYALDHHLRSLKEDPGSIYYQSLERWIRSHPRFPDWGVWALCGGGGLLALFISFSVLLRFQVRTKTRALLNQNLQLHMEEGKREKAERESERLEGQLLRAQKMEAMGTLASGVAHDFSNLLTVISAHTTLLRQKAKKDEQVLSSLSVMDDAVKQATSLTRSLLTLSRKLPTVSRPVHLNALLETTSRMLRRIIPARIELSVTWPEEDLWTQGDETQLQQVLLNLALNARDAMPKVGKLRLNLDAHEDTSLHLKASSAATAHLTVEDTGTGMTDDVRERIFDPFYTTKPEDQGTGLGLACVKSILEEHNGHIAVESSPDMGSTFVVGLPLIAPPKISPGGEPEEECHVTRGNGEVILLAEDQQQIREVLTSFLSSLGYNIITVPNSKDLDHDFQRLKKEVRLLVLDVDLPQGNGLDFMKKIRLSGVETPAILISGSAHELGERLTEFTMLLTKPFELTELGELIHETLQQFSNPEAPE